MTLHGDGVTLALRSAGDVDAAAVREDLGRRFTKPTSYSAAAASSSNRESSARCRRRLTPPLAYWPVTGLLTLRGLISPWAKMHGAVTITFRVRMRVTTFRAGLDDRHRNDLLFSSKTWVITQLRTQDSFSCHLVDSPTGCSRRRWRKIDAHQSVNSLRGRVEDVDEPLVSAHLEVLRESLYLCGDRMTQYTFFSVGSGTGPTTLAPVRVTVSTILRAGRQSPRGRRPSA